MYIPLENGKLHIVAMALLYARNVPIVLAIKINKITPFSCLNLKHYLRILLRKGTAKKNCGVENSTGPIDVHNRPLGD